MREKSFLLPIALKRYHRSVVSGTIIALRAVLCKIIAIMAFCHIANWVEKSFIVKAILREYCKVAIVVSFRLYPMRYKVYIETIKLYPIRCKLKNFHYICPR